MTNTKYKPHRFADFLPHAHKEDYAQLKGDIQKHKRNLVPIMIYEDQILDGRQRYRACMELGLEPVFEFFEGTDEDALGYVWSMNICRRDMSASEKAVTVALFYTKEGEMCPGAHTMEQLADQAGGSRHSVTRAKKVLDYGTDEEKQALLSGRAKAKPLAEAIARRATTVEPSQEAQDNWIKTIRESSIDASEFAVSCTPGYYNNEGGGGGEGIRSAIGDPYMPGFYVFDDLLKEWRAKGDLDGLVLENING